MRQGVMQKDWFTVFHVKVIGRAYIYKIVRSSEKNCPNKYSLTFWTFTVTLTLNAVIPFFHRTLWLMMLYYQTKFVCKWTSGLEDTLEIIIFWLYKPSVWPWHWRQQINFSEWHSGSWCCITISSLVSKWSVLQKILSGQTFTNILNLHCDLDLECSNKIFAQKTPAYDVVVTNQVWSQTDQQFRRKSRNSHIFIM